MRVFARNDEGIAKKLEARRFWCVENTLEIAAAFHRFQHRHFIRVFEIGANGNTDTDARDAHAERLEELREINGSSFAFSGGVGGDDDFVHAAAFEALDQGFDVELLRAAALKGRKRAAEDVVHTAVGAGLFDSENVVWLFDDTDGAFVAGGAGAVEAGIGVGDVVASGAGSDLFFGIANGVGEAKGVFRCGAQDVERKALGSFLADTGKMFQFVDQSFNWSGKIRHVLCVA
jgi:hypothetical protein